MLSSSVGGNYQTILLAVAGVSAAFGALVLAVLPVLLFSLSGPYRILLRKTPHGVPGVVVPFGQSVAISLGASASAITMAIAWSIEDGTSSAIWQKVVWILAASVPLVLWLWSLGASIMLVGLMQTHLRNQETADQLEAEQRRALERVRANEQRNRKTGQANK